MSTSPTATEPLIPPHPESVLPSSPSERDAILFSMMQNMQEMMRDFKGELKETKETRRRARSCGMTTLLST